MNGLTAQQEIIEIQRRNIVSDSPKAAIDRVPSDVETPMIAEFRAQHAQLPFANFTKQLLVFEALSLERGAHGVPPVQALQ